MLFITSLKDLILLNVLPLFCILHLVCGSLMHHLYQHKLLVQNGKNFRRIAYEKPFGKDYRTAKKINQKIAKICSEDQIYRVDHYLARPIVQNIFYTRFTNKIFEAIWHKDNIESITILFSYLHLFF